MPYIATSEDLHYLDIISEAKRRHLPSASSKASGILFSALASTGWRLPEVPIIDSDEKYLFDAEVRIKLFHPSSLDLLLDILADFPPSVIMSRVGMLQLVLDIVGSTSIQGATSETAFNPLNAIDWLNALISKSVASFHDLLDGSKVSDLRNLELVHRNDGEDNETSPSLALQMVSLFKIS
jgi:hypothetical protein